MSRVDCQRNSSGRAPLTAAWSGFPIAEENLDHLTPEREQLVEPLRIVVPQCPQRHSANKTERQSDDVGCKLAGHTARRQGPRPGGLNRTSRLSRNIENLLAHRLIGRCRKHDIDRNLEMLAKEKLPRILDHRLDQI